MVKVQFKNGKDTEFKEFSGCGNYLPDLALHDIWVLDKINDVEINESQERPRFEFFSMEKEVLGNAGCNDFNSKFSIIDFKQIKFEALEMTEKFCNDMVIENKLKEHIFEKIVKYERQGLYLNLSSFDGMVFTFKKVD
jgi:heat shock protein HslJ